MQQSVHVLPMASGAWAFSPASAYLHPHKADMTGPHPERKAVGVVMRGSLRSPGSLAGQNPVLWRPLQLIFRPL